MLKQLSEKLFNYFIVNHRYFAIQKGGLYFARNQYINQKTIENILKNKESFLVYQEDYNYVKWICFDFDINKEFIVSGEFEEKKEFFYKELIAKIQILVSFLEQQKIDYLLEFSGNRGLHIWILFDNKITRQDAFIIFQSILNQSKIILDTQYFSLDKYPKSMYSSKGTDKGTGVKIPLSFHQKSKRYSLLFNSLEEFDISGFDVSKLDMKFLEYQYSILDNYTLQNRDNLFEKLYITEDVIKEEQENHNFLNSISTSFQDDELSNIIDSLNACQHLKTIFSKEIPSDKERRVVVGLLGQLKNKHQKIGKVLLKSYFMSRKGAIESIIDQRLVHADKFCPPTCDYFRSEYGVDCRCESIDKTPLEFLKGFDYISKEIFDFTSDIFYDIKKSQIRYTKQNDEIALFHILNNLNRYEYNLINNDIDIFLNSSFDFENTYNYIREEKNKNRSLYSISARDKIITTFAIKVLDSLFYKKFSSRSFGYKFNPSFRHNNIFENWLKQWNMYKRELETLIYSKDFKHYYILKLDIKSYYDTINLQKLQIELNYEIEQSFNSEIIDKNEQKIFLNIINNLIAFSKKMTNDKEKGLPQGPAYARYLAEIYLTSLDRAIEKIIEPKNGYYYRYVDDMFIILPRKEDINDIEQTIIEHLDTKYLTINPNKTYKGMINTFRGAFDEYIDNTKYFIDNIDKYQYLRTKTMIHKASSKLLELVEQKNEEINDKNLTFFFTHFNDSKMVERRREELEHYVISEAKGRGSFFNIFWMYYFKKHDVNQIEFSIFNHLVGLKRETFLNSLIIVSKNHCIQNITLKSLLDIYLETDLTQNEQLSLLELYMLNQELYNSKILDIIGNKFSIYNDLMLSEFSKDIPEEILDIIASNLTKVDKNSQFEYLYNIMLFSNSIDSQLLAKFSTIFIDIVHTVVQDGVKTEIEYLAQKTNLLKYIQLLYISMLFYTHSDGNSFENIIFPLWQNLLYNIDINNFENLNIKKLSHWKDKIEKVSLEESNINFILLLLKDNKYHQLRNGFSDTFSIVANYFDAMIELIYLSHEDDINLDKLDEIKQFLIKEKNMIYLDWIDGEGSYYPTKELCIRNAIYNDITVLKRDNQLLVRLLNNHEFNIDFGYLNIIENSEENIFNHKYRTIIYEYDINQFEQPNNKSFDNLFKVIFEIINTHNNLEDFSEKYCNEKKYINHFYNKFSIHIDDKVPLIPYDVFTPYFIKEKDKYNPKIESNYFYNLIEQIQNSDKKFFPNEQFGIFDDFRESFFPKKISSYSKQIEYLKYFVTLLERKVPQSIFDMENYLIQCIFNSKENMQFFEFFDIYLSFNRSKENKKYLLFDYVDDLKDSTLDKFFITIEKSLKNNSTIKSLLIKGKEKTIEKLEKLENYKKYKLNYEISDEEIEININDNTYGLDNLEYIKLDFDTNELQFFDVPSNELQYLEQSTLYVYEEDEKAKLIVIPTTLMNIYTIIKERKKAFEKPETSYLIKPFKTIEELKDGYDDNFNKAVKVLMAHQKYNNPIQSDMEQHLYQWLSCFRDNQQMEAMLYVIANHQYLADEDVSNFVNNIQEYKERNEYLITTLKTAEDNNGTHRLITLQTEEEDLWRDLKTIGLQNFPTKLINSGKEKIIFLADVMISGSQTIKAFQNYYLAKVLDDETRGEEDYFKIDKEIFQNFKSKLLSLKEIIFISTIYTSKAKDTIIKYLNSIDFKGTITFIGKEKEFNDCIFNGLIEQENKNNFIPIIQNTSFVKNNFDISPFALKNAEFSETNVDKRNIIVRFNSMPKKRFFIFTLQPKYYNKPLFQYRKDN